jgi:hypothetical protein
MFGRFFVLTMGSTILRILTIPAIDDLILRIPLIVNADSGHREHPSRWYRSFTSGVHDRSSFFGLSE